MTSTELSHLFVRLECACGRKGHEVECIVKRGGAAPVPCGCGRSYAVLWLEKDTETFVVDLGEENPEIKRVH